MPTQNFKNHFRIVPIWHFVTSLAILAAIIGSFVNLSVSWNDHDNFYSSSLICLVTLILAIFYVYIRSNSLRVQDRVIRAEENLRNYILNGKLPDSRLTMKQTIALRFAPDEELGKLSKRAVDENLNAQEIKKAIVNWKEDTYRV